MVYILDAELPSCSFPLAGAGGRGPWEAGTPGDAGEAGSPSLAHAARRLRETKAKVLGGSRQEAARAAASPTRPWATGDF